MRDLLGKRAIITGASGGVGREIALALAENGVNVALAARSEDALRALADQVQQRGAQALVVPADVTDQDQVQHLVNKVIDTWGGIDIVIANAGVLYRGRIQQLEIDALRRSMDVNFFGAVYLILASLPHLIAQGNGPIVVTSSADAIVFLPLEGIYVAAKSAIYGLADVLRQDLRGTGVDVTILLPGRIQTQMIEGLRFPRIVGMLSPQQVARATIRAIRKRRPVVVMPIQVKLFRYIKAAMPRFGDWLAWVLWFEGQRIQGEDSTVKWWRAFLNRCLGKS